MFQDKVVVITGGAGGIGKCIREEFEKAGLKVFTEKYEADRITLVISPSGVPKGSLEKAAQVLADVILCKA